MSDTRLETVINRARQYEAVGYESSHAFQLAAFEARLDTWPEIWGSDLVALIFGDFKEPNAVLDMPHLGITIEPEKQEGTVIKTALTVLQARVKLENKSVASVKDAARRLNTLVGVLSYMNQGAPIRWWCYLTSPSGCGIGYTLGEQNPSGLLSMIELLSPAVRKRVTAALYWLREPRGMLLEKSRTDQMAVFAGYWNAFECLVDAASTLEPLDRRSRSEKNEAIEARLAALGGVPDVAELAAIYRDVVDPGFKAKASHGIRLCTGSDADRLIVQAFDYTPSDHGLYALRNAINHGTVDVDDPETTMLIDSRFSALFVLVYSMCNGLLRLNFDRVVAAMPSRTAV